MSHVVPIERKKAAGNPGKRPLPQPLEGALEPVKVDDAGVVSVPPAPSNLTSHGQALWSQVWTHARQWLHPINDLAVVGRYCHLYQLRHELEEVLDSEGLTATGSMGQTVSHPALRDLLAVDAGIARAEQQLGLSPADRAKLGLSVLQAKVKATGLAAFYAQSQLEDDLDGDDL